MRLGAARATLGAMAFRVLIVDDNGAFLFAARRLLAREGLQVVGIAATGAEALRRVGDLRPDVVLVDWNMPVMDGLTFIKTVRARDDLRDITIMMVTTESEQGQIVRALAAGAHEYILKPFTDEVIAEKLALLGLVAA